MTAPELDLAAVKARIAPPSGVYDHKGARLTAPQIDEASRRRRTSADPYVIPDVPLDRYDVCVCGKPRFMHPSSTPFTRPGLIADEFGGECWRACDDIDQPSRPTKDPS